MLKIPVATWPIIPSSSKVTTFLTLWKWRRTKWIINKRIFNSIKNINKEKKVTIFLVEQNAKKALELADRAYVLVNGKVAIKGTGQELLKNQDIQAAYLEGGIKK